MRILITGIAGSGKTTAMKYLLAKGYNALDLDTCGACAWVNKETGEQTNYAEGAGKEWIEKHRWQVVVPELIRLLELFPTNEKVFVGGKVAKRQIDRMREIFDTIYLLKPSDSVIDGRLATRKSNITNFGKRKEERQTIVGNRNAFEEACLTAGATVIENEEKVEDLVEEILSTCNHPIS